MTEIRNLVKLPTDLNLAEKKFARCLAQGDPCFLGDAVPKDHDNTIREEVICFFVYGGDEENPVLGTRIFLQGARVSGCLDLTHMEIPYALIFRKCRFDHAVNMRHAECRELDLQGSHLQGGLAGNPLRTKGGVRLSKGFVAKDGVLLSSARIGGALDCSKGEFCEGLSANKAKMEVLIWREVTGGGEIQLKAANADVLDDDLDSWRSFKVDLDGFTYGQFVNHADAQFRIGWLAKRPDKMGFSPLPYEQAAKVLFGMGHSVEAWDILREKRRLEREHSENSWLQRVGGWMIDTLTDFVYRPLRTVKWTAGIVLVGAILFGVAGSQGKIVPHQPAILSSGEYQDALDAGMLPMEAALEEFPEYPEFNFLAFSLDVFIPLFSLHQESFWAPASGDNGDFWKSPFLLALSFVVLAIVMFLAWLFKGSALAVIGSGIVWGPVFVLLATVAAHFLFDAGSALWFVDWRWLTVWYWIEIMAGWLLSSLLLLSVTGLLRPRIGGGD